MNGVAIGGSGSDGQYSRVKINVGGKIFETTTATLRSAGFSSLLARSAPSLSSDSADLFFDRDPEIFNVLLQLLRTGRLYYDESRMDKDALIEEANHYGILGGLKSAMAPAHLDGIDVEKIGNLLPNGRDIPSALCAGGDDGSLWLGHGSKITVFDWAMRKHRTTLTEFSSIDSLHRISETHVAAGSADFPGLHVYDVARGVHSKSLIWQDKNDTRIYKPAVRAICSSSTTLFTAFENGQKTENTVLLVDRSTMQVSGEVARQTGNSGHSKVATKLQWLPSYNLLLTVGVHGGAFGFSGYIRAWDVRQNLHTWEWKEPNVHVDPRMVERDSFSDITADESHAGIFKVSVGSGNIAMADLRHLNAQNPWMYLTESNSSLVVTQGGPDVKLLSYNKQLYCSRGGDLEVWSEVPLAAARADLAEKEYWEMSFRRNFIEHSRRYGGHDITHIDAGGDRLFVARKEMQSVEVWETRRGTSEIP